MDDSPLLPSQFQDASSEPKKPTSCWMKLFKMMFLYFGSFANISMFIPWFQGDVCPQIMPSALIIALLMTLAGILASVLMMVHNCKLNTFTDPQVIDQRKLKDGEKYKGFKPLFIVSQLNGFVQVAAGIWALIFGIMNRDLFGVDGCQAYLLLMMIMGGMVSFMILLMVVGGIVYAIKSKGKANE